MVLSQLLAPLVAKALGSFVKPECLEEDSLRVGIWRGHVQLSNLCLRDDLLDLLGLPLTLRFARCARMGSGLARVEGGRGPTWIARLTRLSTTYPPEHRIGHIEVEIPWSQLGRKAVVIKVEGVHVLAYAKYQVRAALLFG